MTAGWAFGPSGITSTPGWGAPFIGAEQDSVCTVVTLAGLTISMRRDPLPSSGYAYQLQTVDGWRGPAEDRTVTMEHPSGDGDIALLPRSGPRSIELTGLVSAKERPVPVLREALARLTQVRRGTLVVDEGPLGLMREADVRVVGVPHRPLTASLASFSLLLVADDPLRFGSSTMRLTNGVVQVPNRGDATLSPVLDLAGPHGALTIVHPGGTYTFPALAAGQSRTLDWRNGDVWNGNVRVFGVEGGRRPAVLAGGSPWTVSGLGAGTATLRRYEAWT